MAKSNDTVKPAEQAELPAQLYTRGGKPNPREADVRAAAEATNEAVANGQEPPWFVIREDDPKAAKATDQLLRRAQRAVGVKVTIKLPQTEPGSVYFQVKPPQQDEAAV